jgi:pimeloyl-ACP methyl ester carboxylesterase
MQPRENTITLDNGLRIHYWESGSEQPRPVLLLHGGMGDAHLHWSQALPLLADEFRVIAPDLPGFGGSMALPRPGTDALLDWIRRLVDALGLDQVALVGSDFGALLARLFGAAYPEHVPALVMVNGGSIPNIPPALVMLGRVPLVGGLLFYLLARSTIGPQQLEQMIHARAVLTPEFVADVQSHTTAFAGMMRALAVSPLPSRHQPMLPVLLLWGAEDRIATLDEARRIQRSIPGAQLEPIADCGHLPQIEAPEVFSWQVTQFLNNPGRADKAGLPGVGRLR